MIETENLMSRQQLAIAYTGPAVANGTMDLQLLGPTLMAMASLVQAANRCVNDDRAEIRVAVKGFSKGSFLTAFDLSQGAFSTITSLFSGKNVATLNDILLWLGLVGGALGTPTGVITILEWLKGRTPTRIQFNQDGSAVIEVGEDSKRSQSRSPDWSRIRPFAQRCLLWLSLYSMRVSTGLKHAMVIA